MNKVLFSDPIQHDPELEREFLNVINDQFGKYGILDFSGSKVYSELPITNDYAPVGNVKYSLIFLNAFVISFVFNSLYNSELAKSLGKAPYNIMLQLGVDFEHKKYRFRYFVDDTIHGLVVGKEYNHICNLVHLTTPIRAKIKMYPELRFFPISRYIEMELGDCEYSKEESECI